MELKDRLALIIKENNLNQKELAKIMNVTEGYLSSLLSGNKVNISKTVASLIEAKLGYNAEWVKSGRGEKLNLISKYKDLSNEHRLAIVAVQRMSVEKISALLVFINSLDEIEKCFVGNSAEDTPQQ